MVRKDGLITLMDRQYSGDKVFGLDADMGYNAAMVLSDHLKLCDMECHLDSRAVRSGLNVRHLEI